MSKGNLRSAKGDEKAGKNSHSAEEEIMEELNRTIMNEGNQARDTQTAGHPDSPEKTFERTWR